MFNIIKIFYSIVKTYKSDVIKIFLYEMYFFIKYFNKIKKIILTAIFNKEKINTIANSTIPCPLYYALIIGNFINKKKIKSILDLGSGHGRLTNFLNYSLKVLLSIKTKLWRTFLITNDSLDRLLRKK